MQTVRLPKSKRVDWALTLERPSQEEPVVRVGSVMSSVVFTCHFNDPLNVPAQIMWDHDCGCVLVVDTENRVVGIITDRDICMASYTQGRNLCEIRVGDVCSRPVHSCQADAPLLDATRAMTLAQVRRLAVTDADGHLLGVIALSDLIRHVYSAPLRVEGEEQALAELLESVSRPRIEDTTILQPLSEHEREVLAEYYPL
jgi:CBS domain-containing protein